VDNIIIKKILEFWHEPLAMVIALPLVFLLLLYFFSGVDFASVPLLNIAAYVVIVVTIFFLWHFVTRAPRARKNRIGIVVAISAETEEQRIRIQKDFVDALKTSLENSRDILRFDFIVLPRWHAEKITDSDRATEYARKCRAHFLIFGTAKVRTLNKKESHVLNLRQLIIHRPIQTESSKKFSQEMSEVFSGRINIDRENDLIGLELASTWLAEAAKYFIGVAAFISGDLNLSKDVLEELRNSKNLAKLKGIPGVAKLRRLIPQRLADIYSARANRAHQKWRNTRSIDDLNDANTNVDEYNRILPDTYQYKLARALWLFVAKHDVAGAIRLLESCRGESEATWCYSLAFLYAYQGKLDDAERQYKKAFTRPCEQSVFFEVEEFIEWVLGQEPDKFQLHYCIGLINLTAKGDRRRAVRDFESFIAHPNAAKYTAAFEQAKLYIQEISFDQDD
jgi:tetratricopeptide (TPR) repeat protein